MSNSNKININVADKPENTRVYLGHVNRFDRDEQLDLAKQIVEKEGLPPFGRGIYEQHEMESFINDLRSDEVALIPLLAAVADKKGSGVGVRFFMNLMQIKDESLYVLNIDTTKNRAIADLITINSDAGKDWYQLVSTVAKSVMRGRKLKKKKAREMSAQSRAKPGLVKSWQLREGTPEYITIATIWSNLNIKPAEKAISMFPNEELQKASKESIQRIWGTRQECLEWLKQLSK